MTCDSSYDTFKQKKGLFRKSHFSKLKNLDFQIFLNGQKSPKKFKKGICVTKVANTVDFLSKNPTKTNGCVFLGLFPWNHPITINII